MLKIQTGGVNWAQSHIVTPDHSHIVTPDNNISRF